MRHSRPRSAEGATLPPRRIGAQEVPWNLQDRLRELNDRILGWAEDTRTPADLVCECVDPTCFSVVTVSPDTYRELRRQGAFLVTPGHSEGVETPALELAS
jgi:hypothetical protein